MIGSGLCLAPFVILALVVASYLTLDRDAAFLRREMMAASNASWETKVQLSVGEATINAVKFGASFVRDDAAADVRSALDAVARASVGVYQRASGQSDWSREKLIAKTDHAMRQRGWSRLVGVVEGKDTVLVYGPLDVAAGDVMKICIAVVSGKVLVVGSTAVNAQALAELVKRHSADGVKGALRLAGISF